ncbi:PKD domain-containing protein [Lysobacter brunescens]|uniref:PKD domain-containing protein n=1 Tax=Lysobacter brunescens TaxID=262323 RepID=A0ABW2YBV5_9GAMM
MEAKFLGLASLVVAGALLAPGTADAQQNRNDPLRAPDARGDKTKGEAWQIEQRRRWWIESRGLKQNRNAAKQRRAALTVLRNQLIRQKRTGRSVSGRAQTAPWRELGPSSMKMGNWVMGRVAGRINAVTPHPTNDSIVFIGAANGGVWKTTDAGASWTPTFVNVGSQSISAIHVEAGNPQNVWAGTGDRFDGDCSGYLSDGVFLSTDGGINWSARNSGMNLSTITSLVTQANNANVVLAAGFGDRCNQGGDANGGIYRSTDKGATWSQVMDRKVEDLVALPGTSTLLASAPGSGVYRSTDGGATWTLLGAANTASRMRLAVAPSNTAVIYALTNTNLYRSDNAGSTWTSVSTTACDGQCTYNLSLGVHPTNPQTIIVGAIRPRRSTNGGSSFTTLTNTWGSSQQVHQDTHVVRYSLNDPNRIWVGGDGGIWRSNDGASSWVNMNANLNITQYYDIVVHPTDPNIVFGGAQDNSSSKRTNSNVWDLTFVNGDGFMNAIDETNAAIVFQNGYPSGSTPSIYRSTQSGAPGTFAAAGSNGLTGGGFPWVTPTDVAGGYHFVGGYYVSRALTSASTMSWTTISPRVGGTVSVITAKKIGSNVHVYAGTDAGKVYYSANAASTNVADVSGNLPAARVSDVAIDPANGSRAFVTIAAFSGSKLYRTTTGGSTWTALGTGLPNIPANTVAIDPLNTQRIFVGTDIGVYESVDGGANFAPFSDGMPAGLVISDLEVDNSPHILTAGTYGRGAWQTTLGTTTGNQPPTANFTSSTSALTATFTDTSTDSDGSIAARSWNFGDSTTSTLANPSKTYAAAGTYTVALTVTDNAGASNTASKSVTVSSSTAYSLSGTVTTSAGAAISGVTVSNGSTSVSTNANGQFTFANLANGTYTLTPSLSGYTFSPASRSATVNGANVTGQNFTGTASTGNWLSQSGSLASGGSATVPSAQGYKQGGNGTYQARLTGPSNADFDLYMYRWNGSAWTQVAKSEGATSTESINYNGTAGYYYLEVRSYSGSGTYNAQYLFPQP